MFELRLSNFIVFRDYKLYDLIVPKLQESYCDFHGITVDAKRPHDKEIREHMWTYLNMKNETNIVLIGMSDYAFPSTRMISFDWLLFNDLLIEFDQNSLVLHETTKLMFLTFGFF